MITVLDGLVCCGLLLFQSYHPLRSHNPDTDEPLLVEVRIVKLSEDGYELATKEDLNLIRSKLLNEMEHLVRDHETLQAAVDQNRILIVNTFRLVRRGVWFVILLQVIIALLQW